MNYWANYDMTLQVSSTQPKSFRAFKPIFCFIVLWPETSILFWFFLATEPVPKNWIITGSYYSKMHENTLSELSNKTKIE